MKFRLFIQALLLSVLVFCVTITLSLQQPTYAGETTFYCGQSKGLPVTFARTQDGRKVPMVRWSSNNYFPPPWTAQRRCQEVSRRFQKNYDNGTLRNIKTGTLRGEPVICAAISQNSSCTDSTLLFTLKRGANSGLTVRKLFDRRGLAAGNVLNESGGDSINIDVDTYLNNATVEE